MAEHFFRGQMRRLKDIIKMSGLKSTVLTSAKYRHPDKSYDEIVAEYKPILFTWASVAKSIGISNSRLYQRIKIFGLETTLLMSPAKRSTSPADRAKAAKKAGIMTNPEIPVFDKDLHLKRLIISLESIGLTEANLKHEAMRRAIDY